MQSMQWRGVFPAVTTKFRNDFSLDFDAMAAHLEYQLDAGVHGIIILGSLGENSTLEMSEKLDMVRFYSKQIDGRVPLVPCIAESSTPVACEFTRQAVRLGADGFMLLPPMRYASDRRETLEYFRTVGRSSDRPIMLYNNPIAYGTDVTPEDFEELATSQVFRAIKESAADTRRISRIRELLGERYALFCGVDDLAFECFTVGAVGWVAGLVVAFPRETVRLYELMAAQNWSEARKLYEWFLPLLHLDIGPKFVQQIKLVEELNGTGSARVRPPRLQLDRNEASNIRWIFESAMESRPQL